MTTGSHFLTSDLNTQLYAFRGISEPRSNSLPVGIKHYTAPGLAIDDHTLGVDGSPEESNSKKFNSLKVQDLPKISPQPSLEPQLQTPDNEPGKIPYVASSQATSDPNLARPGPTDSFTGSKLPPAVEGDSGLPPAVEGHLELSATAVQVQGAPSSLIVSNQGSFPVQATTTSTAATLDFTTNLPPRSRPYYAAATQLPQVDLISDVIGTQVSSNAQTVTWSCGWETILPTAFENNVNVLEAVSVLIYLILTQRLNIGCGGALVVS
ncbi:hypothetical protein D9757_014502 [Collybiopsis confluens]|uniref:Uncharacterized protein n=1 Tax=Collybiopsis confluens TaxID=2823264 RepID=A0A8H5LIM5_9AGAR|nr:hypothetical protein D9757_014502 [Collybiopsis confluens]